MEIYSISLDFNRTRILSINDMVSYVSPHDPNTVVTTQITGIVLGVNGYSLDFENGDSVNVNDLDWSKPKQLSTPQQILKELDFVSQNAHWLTAPFVMANIILFGHAHWLWFFIPGFIALSAWKEFWYDYRYELPDIAGSSVKDFVYYQLGWITQLGLYYLSTMN